MALHPYAKQWLQYNIIWYNIINNQMHKRMIHSMKFVKMCKLINEHEYINTINSVFDHIYIYIYIYI